MDIRILKKEEIGRINDLVSIYKFNDYRAYRMISKDRLKEYLLGQILDLLKGKSGWVLIVEDKKEIAGLTTLNFLPWDTKHFGIKMAKIDYLLAEGNYNQNFVIKKKLLSYLFSLCKKKEILHLSCRIDVGDTSSIHALEVKEFKIMDTLVTYVFNRNKHDIPQIKDIYKIREFKKTDLPVLVYIAKNSFSQDRFHLDPYIPNEKADNLFGEWIRNSCRGVYADRVFVAERNSQPVGFLTFKLNRVLEKLTRYKIAGHGLSAISPKVKGVYPSLVKAATKDIVLHYDCLEFDTQLNNYEVIKVWQRFNFDFIRAKYTFHKWLGD